MPAFCEKCQKEYSLRKIRILCHICFHNKIKHELQEKNKDIEHYKSKCRGLEREVDKLRAKLYYGKDTEEL